MIFLWRLYREGRKNFVAEQGHFSRGLHAAAIMAVCGLLLHSFVDFNLQIPANALFFLLAGLSCDLASVALRSCHHRANGVA